MTDAANMLARLAVLRFSQRCLDHPGLEADPVCVVATERERMLQELEPVVSGLRFSNQGRKRA